MRWWWGPLCTRPTLLAGFLLVLAHWSNISWIDMSPHSNTLSWFPANKSLLFLLNQRSNIYQFYSLWFNPIRARGEHANHYTTDLPVDETSNIVSEWLLLNNYIMERTSYIRWDDNDICFVLDQVGFLWC